MIKYASQKKREKHLKMLKETIIIELYPQENYLFKNEDKIEILKMEKIFHINKKLKGSINMADLREIFLKKIKTLPTNEKSEGHPVVKVVKSSNFH